MNDPICTEILFSNTNFFGLELGLKYLAKFRYMWTRLNIIKLNVSDLSVIFPTTVALMTRNSTTTRAKYEGYV